MRLKIYHSRVNTLARRNTDVTVDLLRLVQQLVKGACEISQQASSTLAWLFLDRFCDSVKMLHGGACGKTCGSKPHLLDAALFHLYSRLMGISARYRADMQIGNGNFTFREQQRPCRRSRDWPWERVPRRIQTCKGETVGNLQSSLLHIRNGGHWWRSRRSADLESRRRCAPEGLSTSKYFK